MRLVLEQDMRTRTDLRLSSVFTFSCNSTVACAHRDLGSDRLRSIDDFADAPHENGFTSYDFAGASVAGDFKDWSKPTFETERSSAPLQGSHENFFVWRSWHDFALEFDLGSRSGHEHVVEE